MTRASHLVCATLLFLAALPLSAAPGDRYDLLIRGGRVVDGSGNPASFADLAVRGGRVVAIGRCEGEAASILDARGLVVAPGFIDVHTHTENVTSLPLAENFLRMGVTSIVTGNCGSSVLDVADFFRRIEATKVSLNVATLVGHNSVRSEAMGGSFDRPPSPAELDRMKVRVEQAMRDGAVGLSTGLIYLPGTFAKTDEIVELAKIAAANGGIYASHMRNEGNGIREALAELFRVAREARIRAEVSHIKLSGNSAWGHADEILALIDQARSEGLDITQDQYVYTASSTGISQLIPSSAREGPASAFRERIADPQTKARIVQEMKESLRKSARDSYAYAVIASYAADHSLNGKSIVEAARLKRGSDSLDDQIELILDIQKNGGASGVFHGINEEDLQHFLRHPNTMIASDGGVREQDASVPHPRSYGNNARVLGRYVRDLKVIRLEDAIRRMTSLPAATFRLAGRGLLRPGFWADVVVFDPAKVADIATYDDPHHYALGIEHVLVNGVPVIRGGTHTGARAGVPLRLAPDAVGPPPGKG